MRIGVPKEIRVGEARVALAPEVIGKLVKQGIEIVIEKSCVKVENRTELCR